MFCPAPHTDAGLSITIVTVKEKAYDVTTHLRLGRTPAGRGTAAQRTSRPNELLRPQRQTLTVAPADPEIPVPAVFNGVRGGVSAGDKVIREDLFACRRGKNTKDMNDLKDDTNVWLFSCIIFCLSCGAWTRSPPLRICDFSQCNLLYPWEDEMMWQLFLSSFAYSWLCNLCCHGHKNPFT